LIVMTIMVILAILAVGGINPIAQVNKGSDAKRKKDLGRIKIAMEDYYNDKGCYPGQDLIITLNAASSCGENKFTPWLSSWPCDNRNEPYKLVVKTGPGGADLPCPKWFKVFTKLDNKKDADIPQGWETGTGFVGSSANTYSHSQVNYGMSSTNVRWDGQVAPSDCGLGCTSLNTGLCNASFNNPCIGDNCYVGPGCDIGCKVTCCDDGHSCD
jgi:type II secretory pathway pseudopilin PulG